MEDIIQPIDKSLIVEELTESKRLRMTNRSQNDIYIVTAKDSPNTMKEMAVYVKCVSCCWRWY